MPAGDNAIKGRQGFQRMQRTEPDLSDLGMTDAELAEQLGQPAVVDPGAGGPSFPGTPPPASVRLSDGWEPDRSYPVPQCNDLDKLPAVLDAIDAGANTADGVAVALGMSRRQGGYYSAGAGWMGLAEVDRSTAPHTWSLTGTGEQMRDLDPDGRAAMLAQMVDRIPEAALADDESAADLDAARQDFLAEAEDDGLGETTAERRAASMDAWRKHAANRGRLANAMSEFTTGVDARIGDARAASEAERAEAIARAKATEPRRGEICTSCGMEKPVSGEHECW